MLFLRRWVIATGICGGLALTNHAAAQTWAGGGTTPSLSQIVTVDDTGESGWPYGQEDVAGDGLALFLPAEQAADLRTAYAATSNQDLWFRAYLSATTTPPAAVSLFVFIDADRNATTGGSAEASEIEPSFTTSPVAGGFEHVVAVRGGGTVELFSWNSADQQYDPLQTTPAQARAETGTDVDPIRLGELIHGYLQATVALSVLDLTEACAADFFVRSVSDAPDIEGGDLDVGQLASCQPPDRDDDAVPDVVVPPGCTSDAQCPGGGICIGGACAIPSSCQTAADCAPDETCTDGVCVVVPGGSCETTADCGARICSGGECVPCTSDAACGDGSRCGGDGRCIADAPGTGGSGPVLLPGEQVQGGAFSCGMRSGSRGAALAGLAALWAFILVGRRGRRNR